MDRLWQPGREGGRGWEGGMREGGGRDERDGREGRGRGGRGRDRHKTLADKYQ